VRNPAEIMQDMREAWDKREELSERLRGLNEELSASYERPRERICLSCGRRYHAATTCPEPDCQSERWEYADTRLRDGSADHLDLPGSSADYLS
jgi:hypothetical protein